MPLQTQFCVKSKTRQEPFEALCSLLEAKGNLLLLGYGYISSSNLVTQYFERIIGWLQVSNSRQVEIYVGLIPDPSKDFKISIDEQVEKVTRHFQKILKEDLYRTGVTDRIFVSAIIGFHCKFALVCNSSNDQNITPISGLFGSTNLSKSALESESRFELDLLITEENPLLEKFSASVCELINEAMDSSEITTVGDGIRNRIFVCPALQEAESYLIEDEIFNRHEYRDQEIGEDDRQALIESDRNQEIYSVWPSRSSK